MMIIAEIYRTVLHYVAVAEALGELQYCSMDQQCVAITNKRYINKATKPPNVQRLAGRPYCTCVVDRMAGA